MSRFRNDPSPGFLEGGLDLDKYRGFAERAPRQGRGQFGNCPHRVEAELAAIGADPEAERAGRDQRLAEQHAARRRFFGLDEEDAASDGSCRHPRDSGDPG